MCLALTLAECKMCLALTLAECKMCQALTLAECKMCLALTLAECKNVSSTYTGKSIKYVYHLHWLSVKCV